MKILVVSDTHGRDSGLERAVELERPFDMLIHCGDVEGREDYIEVLAECPCCIVSGNNDFFSDLPREEEITIAGTRILVTHGHYYGVSMDLSGIFQLYGEDIRAVDGAILSCVVPPLEASMVGAVEFLIGKRPLVVGPGVKTGLNIR